MINANYIFTPHNGLTGVAAGRNIECDRSRRLAGAASVTLNRRIIPVTVSLCAERISGVESTRGAVARHLEGRRKEGVISVQARGLFIRNGRKE
jgi:hypothetical protein